MCKLSSVDEGLPKKIKRKELEKGLANEMEYVSPK